MSEQRLKILDVEAVTAKGNVKLQAAFDINYLYKQLRSFFEQELFNDHGKLIDQQHLQKTLNTKAKDIEALNTFTFDNDMRAIELAVLITVLYTTKSVGGHDKKYIFFPAWQLPRQAGAIKAYSGKESWDGFLLGIPIVDGESAISIPLELKSLMDTPDKPTTASPNDQLAMRLEQFSRHFQRPGSINCVLAMPYTNKAKLDIDVKIAADNLRDTISTGSAGCICMLSFPNDKDGKLAMSILCVIVSQNPNIMRVDNKNEWMREINFGKAS